MNLFHTHFFKPSETDPDTLYCSCGQTRDIHRHSWEDYGDVTQLSNLHQAGKRTIGKVLKCKVCGIVKTFNLE